MKQEESFTFSSYQKVTNDGCCFFQPVFQLNHLTLSLSERKAHGMKGGDSSGISEKAETPQERSDEEAWPRPRKASTCSGMCSPTIDILYRG